MQFFFATKPSEMLAAVLGELTPCFSAGSQVSPGYFRCRDKVGMPWDILF